MCSRIAITILTLLAVACGSEAPEPLTPEQHFEQAQRSMDREKPKEAFEHLEAVVEAEGAPGELKTKALFGIVHCQAAMGAGSGTQRWLARLEGTSPKDLDARFYLGIAQTLLRREQIEPARQVVETAEQHFPDDEAVFEKITGELVQIGNDVSKLRKLGYLGSGSEEKVEVDLRAYSN